MVVNCNIVFDQNESGTYFAGQLVSGTVTLESDKPKDIKGILFKISGFVVTRWYERKHRKRSCFSGREDYLSYMTYFVGSEQSSQSTILPGTHTYTFSCQLPHNCPSSFEGLYGQVRYTAKVVLVRPWKFDQIYTRGFTVLATMDLNYEAPQLRLPSNSEVYKVFCCGPCKTEPLKLELSMPQTGFVPGQNIPVTVLVINNTNIPVASVTFELVMLVRYFSQPPIQSSCVERIVVTKMKGDSVLRNCTRSLSELLHVPATPPTCVGYHNLIQIAYQVEVEAKMKGMHGAQSITGPVTIGNIPLWQGVVQNQPTSSQSQSSFDMVQDMETTPGMESSEKEKSEQSSVFATRTSASMAHAPTTPAVNYPNMPPPTYEESVHTVHCDVNEDEPHAFGPSDFAPLYPVYNIPSPSDSTVAGTGNGGAAFVNDSYVS